MNDRELEKYRGCEGLPTDWRKWKQAIPYRPGDIDYELPAVRMIRLTPETAEYLYSEYSPTESHYETGTRPELERQVKLATGRAKSEREKVLSLLEWSCRKIVWPRGVRREDWEFGGTEEDLLARGVGSCEAGSRVLATMCQVAGVAARLTFHWSNRGGHACAEAYVEGKWTLLDSDINFSGLSLSGYHVSCWDLVRDERTREAFDRAVTPQMLSVIGGGPDAKYSDFFQSMGICNYPVEAFPYNVRVATSRGIYV